MRQRAVGMIRQLELGHVCVSPSTAVITVLYDALLCIHTFETIGGL